MDVNENGIEMDSELERELQEVSVEKESRYKDFDARYKFLLIYTFFISILI